MTDDTSFDLNARAQMPSLSDPAVANDALEAFLDVDDRLRGGLAFLICDGDGNLLQPILVDDVPTPTTAEQRRTALRWATDLCEVTGDDSGPLALLVAVTREAGPVTVEDWEWHETAIAACQGAGVTLIGVHLVTMDGSVALPPVTRAA